MERRLLHGRRVPRLRTHRRRVLADEPGELPVEIKWDSVARTLELEEAAEPVDWAVVDVRWDRPELVLRDPEPK